MTRRVDALARYWIKIDRSDPDGCWPWMAGVDKDGYGRLSVPGQGLVRAHRFGYEAIVGPVPAGLEVLHSCDNPPCQRPEHWFLGCSQDNSTDMVLKGRSSKRFSIALIEAVRVVHSLGMTEREIARASGMSRSHVNNVIARRRRLLG